MVEAPVRTRFPPSPTGYLHVGTARTALFNYLYARRHGGTFIVRIEDTDVDRNVADGAELIVSALRWLGLQWDEGYGVGGPHGPYVQTRRLERYRAVTETLLAANLAYRCYCTPDEVQARAQVGQTRPPGYDGHCRMLSQAQVRAFEDEGRRPAVRFAMPGEGVTTVVDLIRGTVAFENAMLTDFVVMRASGMPTYMLSAVCDDTDMQVSHVIRGEDLFPSTPRQVQLFAALGRPAPPVFAHLPLIVGEDRRKLSKRRGEVSVEGYRQAGFVPEALVNYLALLGWSLDDHTEDFSLAELEHVFDVERVSHHPAAFDVRKFEALNGRWLRRLPPEEFARRVVPYLERAGLEKLDMAMLEAVAPLVSERVARLDEVPAMVKFLFVETVTFREVDEAKVFTPDGKAVVVAAAQALEACAVWSADALETALRAMATERGIGAKRAFQPVRLAVTGALVSPPLFESLALLGRERTLARLADAVAKAPGVERDGHEPLSSP